MSLLFPTICAPATNPGGALGIIRISGVDSISIVNSIFSKDIYNAKGYTLHFGKIEDIDDVVVSVYRAPHSYTGEDSVEITHHGSSYIQQEILHLLCEKGCRMAEPGEFTRRSFLNGKMDLSQAEAVADIIASKDAAQHRVAMTQMRGEYSALLVELRDKLLHLISLLELELDFADHEELEFVDRSELIKLAQTISNEIQRLLDSFKLGNAIKNGISVAIIGAPNVGKSTLLNTLLHDDKAIVSAVKGTTRDTIEDVINIQGITFRFIDTAGIHHTKDDLENLGIERSIKAAEHAQIIILLTEPGVPFIDVDKYNIGKDKIIIRIVNKTDDFQAINGKGLPELENQLVNALPDFTNNDILVTNSRHYDAFFNAKIAIDNAIDSLKLNVSGDLVSEDLKACVSYLGEILGGEITNTEVLTNIFSHFCIGK